MLRTARRYDPSSDSVIFGDGTAFNCDALRNGGLQDYVDDMFDFARRMSLLEVDNAEYGLLTAISIFSGIHLTSTSFSGIHLISQLLLLFIMFSSQSEIIPGSRRRFVLRICLWWVHWPCAVIGRIWLWGSFEAKRNAVFTSSWSRLTGSLYGLLLLECSHAIYLMMSSGCAYSVKVHTAPRSPLCKHQIGSSLFSSSCFLLCSAIHRAFLGRYALVRRTSTFFQGKIFFMCK